MNTKKSLILVLFLTFSALLISGCNGKLPGGDARKFPADPAKRVEQNLKEGRGFKLNDQFKRKGGVFDFANANELWRASLDVIDFMPLSSVNYSGGIIITDWYSENNTPNESIKISIRFQTNEIRSDALDIKIFRRICENTFLNCKYSEMAGNLSSEIKKEILKKATIYEEEKKKEDRKLFN
jgi:hypothetical protein|tara:strand:- start:71 stop:616 length:546 start_codon:yes stop_codon:yes gene_type:complete